MTHYLESTIFLVTGKIVFPFHLCSLWPCPISLYLPNFLHKHQYIRNICMTFCFLSLQATYWMWGKYEVQNLLDPNMSELQFPNDEIYLGVRNINKDLSIFHLFLIPVFLHSYYGNMKPVAHEFRRKIKDGSTQSTHGRWKHIVSIVPVWI